MAGGMHGRGHAWQGYAWLGGMCGRGACMVRGMRDMEACMAGETATSADGTHRTGMHSCLLICHGLYYS